MKKKKEVKPANPNCPICRGNKSITAECSTCHGRGEATYDKSKVRCRICNGNGYTTIHAHNIGRDDTTVRCDSCHGTGYIWQISKEKCWECKGTGSVRELCCRCNDGVDYHTQTKQEVALEKVYAYHDKLDRQRKERAVNSIFFILAAIVYGGGLIYRVLHHSVKDWSLMANIAGAWYYNLIIAPFVIPWKYVYSLHLMSKAIANGVIALIAVVIAWGVIVYVLDRAYKFINPHNEDVPCLATHFLFFLSPAIGFLIYLAVKLFIWCL